jgi:hypothetical protein
MAMKLNAEGWEDNLDWQKLGRLSASASKEMLRKVTLLIKKKAISNAPQEDSYTKSADPKREGYKPLKQSIAATVKTSKLSDETYSASVHTTNGLGYIIEVGTGLFNPKHSHMIKPKKAKVMIFSSNAWWYRLKQDKGRRGTPYLLPALKSEAPKGISILRGELHD